MTTALPTRPKYARENLTFTQAEIAAFVAAGAKVFGEIVVAKVDGRTVAIRPEQVIAPAFDDDNAAEAELADQDRYEAQADALGISVGELTDGEYEDTRPRRKAFDADLLAQFS